MLKISKSLKKIIFIIYLLRALLEIGQNRKCPGKTGNARKSGKTGNDRAKPEMPGQNRK